MIVSVASPILVRPLAVSAVNVGTPANTNETVLKTYTIPAGMLRTNGIRLKYRFNGLFAANANTKNLRIRCGPVSLAGTVVFASGAVAFNNTDWVLEGSLFRRDVDSQDWSSALFEDGTVAANIGDIQAANSVNDDDAAMILELTGQNGAASANDIQCSAHWIEWYAAPI